MNFKQIISLAPVAAIAVFLVVSLGMPGGRKTVPPFPVKIAQLNGLSAEAGSMVELDIPKTHKIYHLYLGEDLVPFDPLITGGKEIGANADVKSAAQRGNATVYTDKRSKRRNKPDVYVLSSNGNVTHEHGRKVRALGQFGKYYDEPAKFTELARKAGKVATRSDDRKVLRIDLAALDSLHLESNGRELTSVSVAIFGPGRKAPAYDIATQISIVRPAVEASHVQSSEPPVTTEPVNLTTTSQASSYAQASSSISASSRSSTSADIFTPPTTALSEEPSQDIVTTMLLEDFTTTAPPAETSEVSTTASSDEPCSMERKIFKKEYDSKDYAVDKFQDAKNEVYDKSDAEVAAFAASACPSNCLLEKDDRLSVQLRSKPSSACRSLNPNGTNPADCPNSNTTPTYATEPTHNACDKSLQMLAAQEIADLKSQAAGISCKSTEAKSTQVNCELNYCTGVTNDPDCSVGKPGSLQCEKGSVKKCHMDIWCCTKPATIAAHLSRVYTYWCVDADKKYAHVNKDTDTSTEPETTTEAPDTTAAEIGTAGTMSSDTTEPVETTAWSLETTAIAETTTEVVETTTAQGRSEAGSSEPAATAVLFPE